MANMQGQTMKNTGLFLITIFLITITLHANIPEKLVRYEGYEVLDIQTDTDIYVQILFNIEEGWHINSHEPLEEYYIPAKIVLESHESYELVSVDYPEPGLLELESLGGKSSVFDGTLPVILRLKRTNTDFTGESHISGRLSYQGCNNNICLIPMDLDFSFTLIGDKQPIKTNIQERDKSSVPVDPEPVEETDISLTPAIASEGTFQRLEEASPYASKNFFLILFLVFIGGLALNLTPCVYPLIPVTISYFGSRKGKGNLILMAVLYVTGMALTYSVLGTAAALSGGLFGSLMANPVVLVLLALLMVLLSLSMFGVYEFRLPYRITQLGGGSRSGYMGALLMGLTMGIVAAPCIGPFVISLLTYVAALGNPFIGFLLFFAMSLGLGIPYILLAVFSARIDRLPRSGEWLNGVRIFFGLILLGMALWFVHPLLPQTLSKIILPVYLIIAGFYFSVLNRSGQQSAGFRKVKIILSLIMVMAGTWMIKPEPVQINDLDWQKYDVKLLEEAKNDNKFVMIDFYSDSCVPCKELDAITFRDPEVVKVLKDFSLIKVDLTRGGMDLIKKYNILGFPTVIFIGPDGSERKDLRLLGYENPVDFLNRLKSLIKQ